MIAIRGMVKSGWPAFNNDQGFIYASSFACANAARALVTFLSNLSSSSFREVTGSSLYGGAPGGDMSNESLVMVSTAQPVMLAMCVASEPMGHDFGCGFQPS